MSDETEKPETVADIVSHFRNWADRLPDDPDDGFWFERPCGQMQEMLRDWADRIEKAHSREMDNKNNPINQ